MEVSNLSKVTQMVCCKALRLLQLSYGPNHYCSFFDINNVNINEKVHVECLLYDLCWAAHISYIQEILQSLFCFSLWKLQFDSFARAIAFTLNALFVFQV